MNWRGVSFGEAIRWASGKKQEPASYRREVDFPDKCKLWPAIVFFKDGTVLMASSDWSYSASWQNQDPDPDACEPHFWIGEPD